MKDKNIFVTGVTSGIGLGVAQSLLALGCNVYGVGRNIDSISHLQTFDTFRFQSLDLSNTDLIENSVTTFLEGIKIDGFVHCAGIEETMPISLYKPQNVREIFDINVFSGVELLRVLSKKKLSNEGASFVFLASVMSELGQPGKIGYCTTKSAVLGLVKSASLELAKRKIRVNAVSPGVVVTPMTNKLFDLITQENKEEIIAMHPLGLGEVQDIAELIIFLLSSKSRWITGQNIKIDGGYSVH